MCTCAHAYRLKKCEHVQMHTPLVPLRTSGGVAGKGKEIVCKLS